MFAPTPSVSPVRWGRASLVLVLAGLPLFASCTSSEDTEPFIPAVEGARQPTGSGKLLAEDAACPRVLAAAKAAYSRLGCEAPSFGECPAFLRPAGGSGCYEYYEASVTGCEASYKGAQSCRGLSPCIVTAERNDALPTCELESGAGGQDGQGTSNAAAGAASGGAAQGGASPEPAIDAGASGGPAAEAGASGGPAAVGGGGAGG